MTSSLTTAQHFLECEKCTEKPAIFICKTCPANLCEECKTDHESGIARAHKILSRKTSNKGQVSLRCCKDHPSRQLESFCCRCNTPVCTECILTSHEGHLVRSLTAAYDNIKEDLQKKKERIERELLPQYKDLLDRETNKRQELSRQADEIEKQIERHTQLVIEKVKAMREKTVGKLQVAKEDMFREIDGSCEKIEHTLHTLQETKDKILMQLEEKPEICSFQHNNSCLQDELKTFCKTFYIKTVYEIPYFQPGPICDMIAENFGTLPKIKISEEVK